MRKIINYWLITILVFTLGCSNVLAVKVGDTYTMSSTKKGYTHDLYFWDARLGRETRYIEDEYRVKDSSGKTIDVVCVDPGINAPGNGCVLEVTGLLGENGEEKKHLYALSVIMSDKSYSYLEMSIAARAYAFKYLSGMTGGNAAQAASIVSLANWMEGTGEATLYGKSGDTMLKARELYWKGLDAMKSYTGDSGDNKPKVTATVTSKDLSESSSGSSESGSSGFNYSQGGDASASTTAETKKINIIEFKLEDFGTEAYFAYDGYTAGTASNFNVNELGVSFTKTDNPESYSVSIPTGTNIFEIEEFKSQVKENDGKKSLTFYLAIETSASLNEDEESGECGSNVTVKYSYKGSKSFAIMQLGKARCSNRQMQDFIGLLGDGETDNEEELINETVEIGKMECSNDPCQPALCVGDNCEYNKTLPQICEDDAGDVKDRTIEYKFVEAYNNGYYNIKKCLLKGGKDAAGNSYKLVDNENASNVADNPYCEIRCKEDYVITLPYKLDTEGGRYFKLSVGLKGQQDCYSTQINTEQFNQDKIAKVKEIVEAYNEWARYYELLHNSRVFEEELRCTKKNCPVQYAERWVDPPGQYVTDYRNPIGCNDEPSTTTRRLNKEKITFGQSATYYSVQNINETNGTYTISQDNSQIPSPESFGYLNDNPGWCEYKAPECPSSDCYFDTSVGSCVKWVGDQTVTCSTISAQCKTQDQTAGVCTDFKTAQQDYDDHKAEFESGLATSKDNVERKIEELKELIDEYNSCNGDHNYQAYSQAYQGSAYWEMIYKYDPEIKYSYDEPEPNNPSIAKWIDQVKGLSCDNGSCDTMFSIDAKINAEHCGGSSICQPSSTVTSVMDEEKTLEVNTYCIGDITNDYTCQGEESHELSDSSYEEKETTIFEFVGDKFVTKNEKFKETKLDYVHKVATAEGIYNTRRVYFTGHDNGNVKIQLSDEAPENFSRVPGLPVGANTPQGTYFYILGIDNVGTFYDSGELGRVYGSNPNSLSNYIRANGTNDGPSTAVITQNHASELSKEIKTNEYACTYTVSENTCTDGSGKVHTRDECNFGDGEGDDADWDSCKKRICPSGGSYCVKSAESYYVCSTENYDEATCTPYPNRNAAIAASSENYSCCPNCTVMCIGKCLYLFENDEPNDGKLQVEFRTVSPANMNPNSRQLGYNWDSANPFNTLLAQKAGNTIAEIEARANPNINEGTANDLSTDYALKVKMTPDMVTWIKGYNNDHVDEGSYNNETLRCFDYPVEIGSQDACEDAGYSWEGGKCIMSNIFCYSTFIDELEENFNEQVEAPNRSNAISNFKAYQGASLPNIGGTPIITNDYWTIYNYNTLDINGDGMADGGPSWK